MELFSLIDPYIEEQTQRISQLFEHEEAITNLGKTETERLLRESMAKSSEETANLKEEMERVKRKLRESQNTTNMLKVESDILQAERSTLLEEVAATRAQRQALEDATTSNLVAKSKELIDTKTANVVLTRNLDETKAILAVKQQEIVELSAELQAWGGYVRDDRKKKDQIISDLTVSKADIEERLNRLKKEMTDLREKSQNERGALEASLEKQGKDLASINHDLAEVKNELISKANELNVYKESYPKTKFSGLNTAVADLKAQAEANQSSIKHLEKLNLALKQGIDEEEKKNESLAAELRSQKTTIDGLKREIEVLVQKAEEKERRSKEGSTLGPKAQELELNKQEIENLKAEGATKQTKIDALSADIERLKQELAAAKSSVAPSPQPEVTQPASLGEEAKLKELIKRKNEKIEQLNSELKSLKEASAQQSTAQATPTQSPQPSQTTQPQEQSATKDQLDQLNQKIKSVTSENEALKLKVSELEAKIVQLESSKPSTTQNPAPATGENKKVGWFW